MANRPQACPTEWRPLEIGRLAAELAGFADWGLCGGHSVALLTGEDTRSHGDIDIGVFCSQLGDCLRALGADRVFLCRQGAQHHWEGDAVPSDIHDLWITDASGRYWVMQLMVFDDEGGMVIYRRDRRVRWPKRCHHVRISGIQVLNPLVTLLFKANKARLEDKEVHDIVKLIGRCRTENDF